jgi:Insertion element 4 transposase N-terminal
VSMTMLSQVYPTEVIERCVQQSEPWSTKVRRVRLSTALTLVWFVIAMALWIGWFRAARGHRRPGRHQPA